MPCTSRKDRLYQAGLLAGVLWLLALPLYGPAACRAGDKQPTPPRAAQAAFTGPAVQPASR